MHRSTTTATLMVTVALTALSGCVSVQRPPASGLPPTPSGPSVPRPDSEAEPRIVQAPAREALTLIGPSRKLAASAPAPRRATPPPPAAAAPAAPRRPRPVPRAERPRPAPRVSVPPAVPEIPTAADLCALGRKYGGWSSDSPEAVICEGAYGR
ncbi:hypothetical protein ACFVGN_26130 [Streptomyces sp. NPDC057757]|uniref:hypothetical protein n=1 Tax=Streptomyces sp. NPDC057757 TaxID=3346241 RepID=UPI003693E893